MERVGGGGNDLGESNLPAQSTNIKPVCRYWNLSTSKWKSENDITDSKNSVDTQFGL